MSMPTISVTNLNRDLVLRNIVGSIALEEAGLAHVLNAEGEKLEYLADPARTVTITELLRLNSSVHGAANGAASIEAGLAAKLATVLNALNP